MILKGISLLKKSIDDHESVVNKTFVSQTHGEFNVIPGERTAHIVDSNNTSILDYEKYELRQILLSDLTLKESGLTKADWLDMKRKSKQQGNIYIQDMGNKHIANTIANLEKNNLCHLPEYGRLICELFNRGSIEISQFVEKYLGDN